VLRAIPITPQSSPGGTGSSLCLDSFTSFRKTKGGGVAASSASLSFLFNGLEMYYYANVNFDTELKKRLLDFFFFQKKKGPYVVIIASLFCKVNCNYALYKRGEEGRGEGSRFASLFSSFCVHGISTSGEEGERDALRLAQCGRKRPSRLSP
jgi:hypothetical protein